MAKDWKIFKRNNNVTVEKSPLKKGGFEYRVTKDGKVKHYPNYEAFKNYKN